MENEIKREGLDHTKSEQFRRNPTGQFEDKMEPNFKEQLIRSKEENMLKWNAKIGVFNIIPSHKFNKLIIQCNSSILQNLLKF